MKRPYFLGSKNFGIKMRLKKYDDPIAIGSREETK